MKLLINALLFIRKFFMSLGAKIFEKVRDPESGKIEGAWFKDKRNVKTFAMVVGVVFFFGVIGYQVLTSNSNIIDGAKNFNEEMSEKVGIKATELDKIDANFEDPLDVLRIGDVKKYSNDGRENDGLPDYSVCIKLLDKLKSGGDLNLDEQEKLKYCLENNIVNLTPEELALAKLLAENSLLNKGEKQLLKDLFGDEKECQATIDQQMSRADGNEFLTKIIEDPTVNSTMIELLKNQDLLRRLLINDNALKTKVGFTDEEVAFLKQLLENCSTDLLLKMLSDPKYKELMSKLLKEAVNNPDFLKSVLNADDLTGAEKDLLRKYLSGLLDPSSDDFKLAESLMSSDPLKKNLARDILKSRELGDEDLANALLKKLTGAEMSDAEKNLAENYDRDALDQAYIAKLQGNDKLADALLKKAKNVPLSDQDKKLLSRLDDLGIADLDDKALLKALQDDMARRQAEIDRLQALLEDAKRKAQEAADRLAKGLSLTPEQQKALQEYADLQKKLQELLDAQNKRKNQYAKKFSELQNFLNQSANTTKVIFPSGLSIDGDAEFNRCKDLPPFKIVKILKKKKKGKRKPKKVFLADGTEATPEQVRIIKAYRKLKSQKAQEAQKDVDNLFNPNSEFLGNATALNNTTPSKNGGGSGINGLFVSENKNLKPFQLSPDMVIPAMLLTEILVTDKGGSQKVRVKILRDIYDPVSGNLVIPKNSIAFGQSGSFDADTGTMQLNLSQVAVGPEVLDVEFSVGSGDLSPGLKGQVRDTRGKLLAGTFITSFTSGALGAIAQNYIAPFQDSDLLGDTLTGAALTGASEIAQRIAEMYAGDLQNAPRIFFVPNSVPVVLIPNN
jgi:molybdenum-dependent DNA-binding transcriptional regulator ModE